MAKKRSKKTQPRSKKKRSTKNDQLIEKMRQYIRTEAGRFLDDDNITSVGIGYKMTNGERSSKLCVQFTVKSKLEDAGTQLEDAGTKLIPKTLAIAGKDVPTDVLEREFRPAFEVLSLEEATSRKTRLDPLVPGISVSHPSGSAGTLGAIVYDRRTGDPCILSNWHVLHRGTGEIGDVTVQPGPHDDNRIELNHVGRLVRSHLGPAGDCAISRIEDREFVTEILDLDVAPAKIARPDLDDRVIKSGRTTDVTRGIVRRIDVMVRLSYGSEMGKFNIGGFEIGPLKNAPAGAEISQGGDSGSVWLVANDDGSASDVMVGLHFAGEGSSDPDEHALACYAHSVFNKLEIGFEQPAEPEAVDGLGYRPNFLSETVRAPWLPQDQYDDAFKLNGSHLIPYTHFSVCQSRSRRLPRFVAWNIDGGRLRKLSRKGLKFRLDPRIDSEFQAGNELYKNNPLDRGHVARRADLTWASLAEAKRANKESFFFTNITPQHAAFNQSSQGGLWGELENAIFEDVDVEDLRVSVIAGPVFRESDPEHRGVGIPREYWKLIAYGDTADNRFKVRAFVLTQNDLLHDLEALTLDPFRMFQVSLARLQEIAGGLDFSAIEEFDTLSGDAEPEAIGTSGIREVTGRTNLFR